MKSQRDEARIPGQSGKKSGAELVSAIRADIISHALKPGQQLHEEELGEKYGVSRTPIREAFLRLEQEGLVKIFPHRGVQISELTEQDIEEIIEIRMELEAMAARVAALKMTLEQHKELKKIEKILDLAANSDNSVLSFEADTRLHDLILLAAGNSRAYTIIKSLNSQIMRIRFLTGHRPGRIATSVAEQKEVIRTLLARDPLKAERAMRVHLLNARTQLLPKSDMDSKFQEVLRKSNMV